MALRNEAKRYDYSTEPLVNNILTNLSLHT